MMTLPKRRHLIILGTILTAIGLIAAYPSFQKQQAAGNEPQKKQAEEKEAAKKKIKGIPGSYIKPVQPDKETQAVLENIGVNSMAFEYFVPEGYRLVIKVLALENDKNIIASLSGVYIPGRRWDGSGGTNGIFRLTRTDPGKVNQNYKGKIRWFFEYGGVSDGDEWEPNRYRSTGRNQVWIQATEKKKLELGKDSLVWYIKTYSKELKGTYPNSPTTFRMEIRVRIIKKTGTDSWNHHPYQDYIEREKKEAAKKARRDKD